MPSKSNMERTEFCYNCKFNSNKVKVRPKCNDCFGSTNTGQLFSYKNWEESKTYAIPMRIK